MFTGGMFTAWRGWLLFDPAAPDPGAVCHNESATSTAEAATVPHCGPVLETCFEQDARDAVIAEDRLLGLLADSITRGATPLQAAQHLFGGRRD